MIRSRGACVAAAILAVALYTGHARADEDANEQRLRDALRQSVLEMRAAQDQAAQAQADLAKAQADKAALQTQLDAANAKATEAPAKPEARPADLEALQAQLRSAVAQGEALQQANARLQGVYQNAAELARAKDAAERQAAAGLKANTTALQTCKATNVKLIGVAEQILHLYQSQGFRSVLLKSYEPVIGFDKVKLENMVQDYDDKIHDQEYVAPLSR